MFADELPLVQQVINDFGNMVEASLIVHLKIVGRGVEYARARAAYDYTSKCEGALADLGV